MEIEVLTAERARKITNSYSKNIKLKRWQEAAMYGIQKMAEKRLSHCILSYCDFPNYHDPLVETFSVNYIKKTLREWLENLGYQVIEIRTSMLKVPMHDDEREKGKGKILFAFDIRW